MSKKLSKETLLKQVQKNREYHNEYMKKARRQGRYQKPKDWVQETTKEGIHLKFDCRWLHKLLQKNQNLRTEENQMFRKELNEKDKAIYKLTNQLERSSILIGKYVAGQEEIVDSVAEYNKTIDEQSKTIELQKKLITKMYKEKVELEKRVQQTIN